MHKKGSKTKKIIISIICVLLVLIIGGMWWLSVAIYNDNFNKRFESYEPYMYYVEDFDGLQRTQYKFESNKGQQLTGYMYSHGSDQKGVVVIAHGFGSGGHNSYMDVANYFASNGYYVFAYDATGNDESEGDGVGGMPQGVIDLEHAIDFIKQLKDYNNLPIVLFGHSWGGYSVSSVLSYHPDVKAVIECSGFESSAGMFESEGKKVAGDGIYVIMPFVKLHEFIKYGKYASNTATDGFSTSDAAVMIYHSEDDTIVPPEYGYDIFYELYRDDPRFRFIHPDNRGHNYVYHDMTYINEFNAEFDEWLKTLDYDYNAENNKERFIADKENYINENLDRKRWSNMLDAELFEQFLEFYNASIE
ncbi:MAG: alpha/beta fold hydrolase [Ruminococcus sp.]|nr:alpha/beta fold hydrolase [Ruminococcus sp.]